MLGCRGETDLSPTTARLVTRAPSFGAAFACAMIPVMSDQPPGQATDQAATHTIGDAARLLGVSENAVRKRIRRGTLEATYRRPGCPQRGTSAPPRGRASRAGPTTRRSSATGGERPNWTAGLAHNDDHRGATEAVVAGVVGAMAVTMVGVQRARAVLEQHGINPDADVDDLTALLEARGWHVSVEQAMGRGRGQLPRWSGHATLAPPLGSPVFHRAKHIRINGPDGREVLMRILGRVLEKEQAP